MPAIEIEKRGPDLYPVLIFRVDGEVFRIVRCQNVDGELIPVNEDGSPDIHPTIRNV
jgi:hypothetical protein